MGAQAWIILTNDLVNSISFLVPIVLSATGGMGKQASVFYKQLASLMSDKRETTYSTTMNWLRCMITYSLLVVFGCPMHLWSPFCLPQTWLWNSCGLCYVLSNLQKLTFFIAPFLINLLCIILQNCLFWLFTISLLLYRSEATNTCYTVALL